MVFIALVLVAAPAAAETLRDAVANLFAKAKHSAPSDVNAVRAEYHRLKQAAPKDSRIDYAYALALLEQHHYATALPLIKHQLDRQPEDLSARKASIWAQLQIRRYGSALDECVQLSELFPKGQPGQGEWQEAARFLGTVFGYFDLVKTEVGGDAKTKSARKNQVLAAIGASYLEPYDEGRQLVIDRLGELKTQQQTKADLAAAKHDEQQDLTVDALEDNRTRIADNRQSIQSATETYRDAERQLTVIRGQLASLRTDRMRVSAQIAFVQSQIMALQQPNQNSRTQTSNVVTRANLNNLAFTLAGLNKQAFDMDRRLLGLQTQAQQISVQGAQSGQSVVESQAAIERAAKRAEALEKQVQRLEHDKPTAGGVLTAQMRSLTTYLPFPFEEQQARVLGWFDGQ